MSFCRHPFQFKSTDLAERHSELMKRFGVSPTDMHLETSNSPNTYQPSEQTSPRLQHRMPQCLADGIERAAENVDSSKHKPKVRIIPIQIEGAAAPHGSNRQRANSGSNVKNSQPILGDKVKSNSNSSLPYATEHIDDKMGKHLGLQQEIHQSNNSSSKPKVIDIPVFVEGCNVDKMSQEKQKTDHINIPVQKVGSQFKPSAPISKLVSKNGHGVNHIQDNKIKVSSWIVSMDKITAVLKELDSYKEAVKNFSGVQGDKEYRYLDEMLTRCMIKLDDVETHGNEDIRKARKAAVKEVEKYVCMLDSKIKISSCEDKRELESEAVGSANNVLVDQEINGELSNSVVDALEDVNIKKMETDIQETVAKGATKRTVEEKKDESCNDETNPNSARSLQIVDLNAEGQVTESKHSEETLACENQTHGESTGDKEGMDAESFDDHVIEGKEGMDAEHQANICDEMKEEMEIDSTSEKCVKEMNDSV